ncbi:Low-salt glycan biosynthesis hexosyltransferase Agl10 [Clostridium pasteurianum DSM 525 = ATCC 6013]|uniref:Glycosyl transferase family 2 n=1 Tax=Clostridium pasteurianum DSM 525 = ATCC 6013 TaxID=1262449 RepID=A0A0H3J1L3_CLOPA|nr:glycosyltransferase family 2 protein [Clostridium pasteurianum]AJA47781.1 Low-salt glycan biosynthesis hexosyltransferase Agl10 [Clostridium pasteurianum DSM 525 = ATCC 6013]AJA51769.1 Low-salt glycan biosynthesis hexosyltransferase Agl10 [Clostridium pasteurianum DSM 525 = ATCC 6013]AOZ75078.1 glycosyl transferase [Clostridium pasteurianum DSM 525 = ATCC 6013]AOZ78873.1 glycosyl transferase [Clostridium pasteurianum]ELP59682.1 glycosyltransferase [Clostridium pasteurianum DSM 525 = ATCC 60
MLKCDLTIIIVNWNARELLKNCLDSIYKNVKNITFEIIVVDNNSTDESCKMLKDKYMDRKGFKLIENRDNKGFAGANNQGIGIAKGEAILLLNPDTIINGDVIDRIYEYLISEENLGIAGCKVLNSDGTLQLACRRMAPRPKDAFFKLFGISKLFKKNKSLTRYNLTHVSEDEFLDVDSVSGCFLMIKREVIDKIGFLDETFFMYGEEMDWCMRAKKAGYIVRYCPVGTIIHYKGESSKQLGTKATYEFYRAMIIFYNKYNKEDNFFLFNWIVYLGIFLLGLIAIIKNLLTPNGRVGTKG